MKAERSSETLHAAIMIFSKRTHFMESVGHLIKYNFYNNVYTPSSTEAVCNLLCAERSKRFARDKLVLFCEFNAALIQTMADPPPPPTHTHLSHAA